MASLDSLSKKQIEQNERIIAGLERLQAAIDAVPDQIRLAVFNPDQTTELVSKPTAKK